TPPRRSTTTPTARVGSSASGSATRAKPTPCSTPTPTASAWPPSPPSDPLHLGNRPGPPRDAGGDRRGLDRRPLRGHPPVAAPQCAARAAGRDGRAGRVRPPRPARRAQPSLRGRGELPGGGHVRPL